MIKEFIDNITNKKKKDLEKKILFFLDVSEENIASNRQLSLKLFQSANFFYQKFLKEFGYSSNLDRKKDEIFLRYKI